MDLSKRFRQVLRTLSTVALLFSAVDLGGPGPAAATFAYASASLQPLGGGDYASELISSAAQPAAMTQSAPKVYVGLFKDNAVGVIDSATNQETRTIPVPNGPHGLVINPDGGKAYV